MKTFALLLSLFNLVHVLAQPAGKKYTFQEIGWSITLPADFTAFPSADHSIQIQQGRKFDIQSPSKRLITAMKDANTFNVALSSCESPDDGANNIFTAANKQNYEFSSKEAGVKCDSATTLVSIDGVTFKRFRLTTKRNNLIRKKEVALYTCRKGYSIYITLLYFDKKAGDELESMLEHSKFNK